MKDRAEKKKTYGAVETLVYAYTTCSDESLARKYAEAKVTVHNSICEHSKTSSRTWLSSAKNTRKATGSHSCSDVTHSYLSL